MSFLNTYSYSDSSTYHWVVTHTKSFCAKFDFLCYFMSINA
nr:MAG TPA: hypothetical protein [Caudoviricetes sp.]